MELLALRIATKHSSIFITEKKGATKFLLAFFHKKLKQMLFSLFDTF